MKKKMIVLALCVLMISGCGSKIPTLSNGDEAVVTLKDGSMISVNELYESVKENYALDSLLTLVDKKILEEKYADQIADAESSRDSTMSQLEEYYGDNLETVIQQYTGYSSSEAYAEYVYLSYLRNLAIEDYCKEQITEKEIKEYYKNSIVSDIKVSHILITPTVTDDMTDEETEAAETEAQEKINTIIEELKSVSSSEVADKFAELAKEYSEDETTKENGGSLGYINKETLSSEYDELVDAAYKLSDGEFSTSIITTELGYHVILRTETKEKADLEDVRDSIVETLAEDYLTDNPTANVEGLREVRNEYEFEIVDTELQSQYATYIQNLISQYQSSSSTSS